MANRGKSSARPVCLDGLQILAESRSSGRKKAASPTFDKVRFIHKANEFLLILTEKGLRISINTKVSSKNRQLDNCWLNPDNLNVNWQALFCDSFHATQQLPRIVLICSVHTFNPVMTQAMWAILQYLYQPLKSCWMNRQRFKLPRNCLFV